MKATVGGRTVFDCTGRAKRKRRQTRLRPVVGKRSRYRIARSAMRAGNEGVAPATTRRIEQFSQAVRAYGHIGTDGRSGCSKLATGAFGDGEASQSIRYGINGIYGVNTGQWRRLRAQSLQQRIDLRMRAFGSNLDAFRIVAHPAVEFKLLSQMPDERPKTNPLDNSGYANAACNDRIASHGRSRYDGTPCSAICWLN